MTSVGKYEIAVEVREVANDVIYVYDQYDDGKKVGVSYKVSKNGMDTLETLTPTDIAHLKLRGVL